MINKRMKCIISMLCMVPFLAIACESEDQRIKQIKNARFEKETEIAQLSRKILEEGNPYCEYRAIALRFWNPSDEQDKEASFDKFIIELCLAFEAGKDTEAICKQAPFIQMEHHNVHLSTLRVALQFLFIERLLMQYKQLIRELTEITKELITLE